MCLRKKKVNWELEEYVHGSTSFQNSVTMGVPIVAQCKWIWVVSMRMRVQYLALISGSGGTASSMAVSCGLGHRHGLDPALLWLWHRLAAVTPIWPLAWELPHGIGEAVKRQKKKKEKKKKKKKKRKKIVWLYNLISKPNHFENVRRCYSFLHHDNKYKSG